MTHPLLRPRWIAGHLLAAAAIVGFIVLGFWQLRRHDEKVTLRDRVTEALASPAIPLSGAGSGEYARVVAAGLFDPTVEFRVPRAAGGVSGYAVIGTFWPESGPPLLVERGWVGIDDRVPPPPREAEVEGVLWPGEAGPPPGEAIGGFFPRIDPAAVSAVNPYDLRPEYLVLLHQEPGFDLAPPEVGEVPLGPHLGYAGQWFLFAAVVAVGYPVLLRRRVGR